MNTIEKKLEEAEQKIALYRAALETLQRRHFVYHAPTEPIPPNSFWTDSREAFALLNDKYLQRKLKK